MFWEHSILTLTPRLRSPCNPAGIEESRCSKPSLCSMFRLKIPRSQWFAFAAAHFPGPSCAAGAQQTTRNPPVKLGPASSSGPSESYPRLLVQCSVRLADFEVCGETYQYPKLPKSDGPPSLHGQFVTTPHYCVLPQPEGCCFSLCNVWMCHVRIQPSPPAADQSASAACLTCPAEQGRDPAPPSPACGRKAGPEVRDTPQTVDQIIVEDRATSSALTRQAPRVLMGCVRCCAWALRRKPTSST